MSRPRSTMIALALIGLAASGGGRSIVGAQQPSRPALPRERVHPELVDTTWGPRTNAAWQLALARRWDDARGAFTALHDAHPDALEALVGLGFVARGSSRRDEARRWYRAAVEVEATTDVQKQLEAVEWDRPGAVDLYGAFTRVGTTNTGDWSVASIVPVVPALALVARVGVLGAGDPLRGVFLDSAASGTAARVLSAGAVIRPTEALTFTTRAEYWSSTLEHQTFVWLDVAQRVNSHLAIRVGARPVSGSTGANQFSAAADATIAANHSATLEVVQGAHQAPFEARTQIRAFYYGAPTVRQIVRLGVLRDAGPTNEATTGFAAATWFFHPTFGLRAEASKRQGAFPRSSAGGGVVFRW